MSSEQKEDKKHWVFWNLRTSAASKGFTPPASISPTPRRIFTLRGYDDDLPTDWWFASTACPLLAATIAPLANVLSIAALVTYWRMNINDGNGGYLPDFEGRAFRDPRWCYWTNVGSLICGFLGNIFLLFNFTGRIRYIIALPASILLFYCANFMLTGITIGLHLYSPPVGPYEIYSQGFWYAVLSIVLYFVCSSILMVNMAGYFLGHYPQRFELNEHQRTLILQTMLFFIWMAGGAAIFSQTETYEPINTHWGFVDGLYFCDVTILTLGYGDLVPTTDLGRGLVLPFSVGGIVMLGLVINSISRFAAEIGQENVVHKHADHVRVRTLERTVADPAEADRLNKECKANAEAEKHTFSHHLHLHHNMGHPLKPTVSRPFGGRKLGRAITETSRKKPKHHGHHNHNHHHNLNNNGQEQDKRQSSRSRSHSKKRRKMSLRHAINNSRQKKIKLLQHERERFDEMRRIQSKTKKFKQWFTLLVAATSFITLWFVGAAIFWLLERPGQSWTYFQSLYFAFISLLTIGYGDFTPKSNAGRSFFVVWSLVAVPTMTLLISAMSSTVIESFQRLTFIAADFTLLLKEDVFRDFMTNHPKLELWMDEWIKKRAMRKRMKEGLPVGESNEDDPKIAGAQDVEKLPSAQESPDTARLFPWSPIPSPISSPVMSPAKSRNLHPLPLTLGNSHMSLDHTSSSSSSSTNNPNSRLPPNLSPTQPPPITLVASPVISVQNHAAIDTISHANIDHLTAEFSSDLKHPPALPKILRSLSLAIQHVAIDVRAPVEKHYSFEEWEELTRLMRFAAEPAKEAAKEEQPREEWEDEDEEEMGETETLARWDWLGENSPLMVNLSEAEFVLEKLCESLVRCVERVSNRVRPVVKQYDPTEKSNVETNQNMDS